MTQSGLYVVATPIGNLEDITYRAVRILAEVDLIAAEDTRHSRVLLTHYGISTPMRAFHEHNEADVAPALVDHIAAGHSLALISDAGTPLVSDPGYRLVKSAREAGLPVYTVPGPSAVTAALSVAGLASDRFAFEGFLPAKQTARRKKLGQLRHEPRTMVFFESSHRVKDFIKDMLDILGEDRGIAVCRELTKTFETVLSAPLHEIDRILESDPNQSRGEFVIVVSGYEADEHESLDQALNMARALTEYLPASQAARVAAKLNGVSRRALYDLLDQ
jgi:16S rRNA (cytidine1402-2'-O)-methyltransferase